MVLRVAVVAGGRVVGGVVGIAAAAAAVVVVVVVVVMVVVVIRLLTSRLLDGRPLLDGRIMALPVDLGFQGEAQYSPHGFASNH